ncbi:MAG: helix-turn-helix transcriptional regulator [Desulfamplus sp.]|nr:helix-turn-helix transcriptional regulator [Desulfamplus sp.]
MKTTRQTHIAKKAGISDGLLSQILTGAKAPSWETAKILSKVTGIPIEFWMESKNNPELLKTKIKELKTT